MRSSSQILKSLGKNAHVHLIGICGTAMASLAGLLKDRGFHVTGSDANPYPPMSTQLINLGIKIATPYAGKNLHPVPALVIVGNVISSNNEEAIEMQKLGLPYCSLPEAMGEFIIDDRNSFVISGTHGKTTTTSMVSWILEQAGLNPGFLIGGIPKNFDQSFRNPLADSFVIEGDEYDTAFFDKVPKFIHYRPRQVILTSVEFDHADIYPDFDHVKSAFARLIDLIPASGNLVYWGDDVTVTELSERCRAPKFAFGFEDGNDFKCRLIDENSVGALFEVSTKTHGLLNLEIQALGRYNVLNATAAAAICLLNGVAPEKIKTALKSFTGVKRRQEIIGEPNGITIIEDFAHHPTAVGQTIEAVQKRYNPRKVFSVFEPRSATSRRKVFQRDYAAAFKNAHEALIASAFDQSKLIAEDRFSTAELVSDLNGQGGRAHEFRSTHDIVEYLGTVAQRGDVVLIMSNGGFDGIYAKLIQRLSDRGALNRIDSTQK